MANSSLHFPGPWVRGAMVWLALSLTLVAEYLVESNHPGHLLEFCLLLSLLWMEFGFAGIFQALRHDNGRKIPSLLILTTLPPVTLLALSIIMARWMML
ncbi:MAG: hypothetical protein GY703_11300 [Gammaproteobacteria bacterium]|nr:hypothetical protein [Gammaproteobacteria bacterium]